MTVPAAKRKRPPSITKEIAAIVKAGLLPKIVHRPDGTVELTGLPPESVEYDRVADDLDARMDAALGLADGDGD